MKSGIGLGSCLVGVAFGSVFATAIALLFFHVIAPNITPPTVTVWTNYQITAVGTLHQKNGEWVESIYCPTQTQHKPCIIPRHSGLWLLMVHNTYNGNEWIRLHPHDGELINVTRGWHHPSQSDTFYIEQP